MKMKWLERLLLLLVTIVIIFSLGRQLLPGSAAFDSHDDSLLARVSEFSLNLREGQFPPRIAPNFSFSLGYPVFNFYAPFSFWVTSGINLLGFDLMDSVKLSFLLSFVVGLLAMYFFLKIFFGKIMSLGGAVLYISSPYLAVESFIRGNLGEVWFFALLPLSLFFLTKNSLSKSSTTFALTSIVISFILTTHNIFFLVFIPLVLVYILLLKNVKRNLLAFIVGLLGASYFILPLFSEMSFLQLGQFNTADSLVSHLLCPWQLWRSIGWSYGLSVAGCTAEMPFTLGKLQIILGLLGLLVFLIQIIQKKGNVLKILNGKTVLYLSFVLIFATFLTTEFAARFWEIFSYPGGIIQFAWRLLLLSVFGLAFFAAYLFNFLSKRNGLNINVAVLLIVIVSLVINAKYFYKVPRDKDGYFKEFASSTFIQNRAAFKVPEHLPRTVNPEYWLKMEPKQDNSQLKDPYISQGPLVALDKEATISITKDQPFEKEILTNSSNFLINIHYLPYWKIMINNSFYQPTSFDDLGRPLIKMEPGQKSVIVYYEQTQVEKIANATTLITYSVLLLLIMRGYFGRKVGLKA